MNEEIKFIAFCVVVSFVFSAPWGILVYLISPVLGIILGAVMFVPCMAILLNLGLNHGTYLSDSDSYYD